MATTEDFIRSVMSMAQDALEAYRGGEYLQACDDLDGAEGDAQRAQDKINEEHGDELNEQIEADMAGLVDRQEEGEV